jgi:Arc/MetJ-type ribon-helix-helix transcriptional regulator
MSDHTTNMENSNFDTSKSCDAFFDQMPEIETKLETEEIAIKRYQTATSGKILVHTTVPWWNILLSGFSSSPAPNNPYYYSPEDNGYYQENDGSYFKPLNWGAIVDAAFHVKALRTKGVLADPKKIDPHLTYEQLLSDCKDYLGMLKEWMSKCGNNKNKSSVVRKRIRGIERKIAELEKQVAKEKNKTKAASELAVFMQTLKSEIDALLLDTKDGASQSLEQVKTLLSYVNFEELAKGTGLFILSRTALGQILQLFSGGGFNQPLWNQQFGL